MLALLFIVGVLISVLDWYVSGTLHLP